MNVWNAWVAKNGETRKVLLDGTYNLSDKQVAWLKKQWKREQKAIAKGRVGRRGWTGFRVEKIAVVKTLKEKAWDEMGKLVGVMEHGGNNRGKEVDEIIKSVGGYLGAPWCGYTVAYAYKKAGSKSISWRWGAVRFLGRISDQRFVKNPELGDIVTFTFDHTGLFGWWSDAQGNKVPRKQATHVFTREGNTGATGAVSDSRTGGDGVYEKVRPIGQVAAFVEVLR